MPVEALLQHVHRLETQVHDGGRRLDLAVAQPPDQVLDAMRDCPETLQPHLRRRPFHRMDRPEKLIDFFWIACSFKRKEAIADDLEMLFGFRLEEFQNLAGHFVVHWQAVEVRPRHRGLRRLRFGKLSGWLEFRLFVVQPRWLRWKRKPIALLERSHVLEVFLAGIADLEQIGFKQRNCVREEFRQGPVQVVTERRIQGILENVSQLSRNL